MYYQILLIDQFIRNTELDVAGKVDYDDTRKYATSSFTANKRYLVTPADFLIIRSLQVFAMHYYKHENFYGKKRYKFYIRI